MNNDTAAEINADFAITERACARSNNADNSASVKMVMSGGADIKLVSMTIERSGYINAKIEIVEADGGRFEVSNKLAAVKFARSFPTFEEARQYAYELCRI